MNKLLIALACAVAAAGAQAQANDTLKKIKDSGSATMGVRESSGALSYTLGDGRYVGFHVEICQRVLADIQSGRFTSKWMQEYKSGASSFKATRRLADEHPIEEVGERLRAMMPWIKAGALVDKSNVEKGVYKTASDVGSYLDPRFVNKLKK